MKNKVIMIVGKIIMISGIFVIFFPTIINTISNFEMMAVIEKFDDRSSQIVKSENDVLYEKIKEYNNELYISGQEIVDAFSYEDEPINLTDYRI